MMSKQVASSEVIMRLLKTPSFSCLVLLLIVPAGHIVVTHAAAVDDLFPPNDEYDALVLDPNTMYGSPLGGFSRATASRLAAIPLKLPVAFDEEWEDPYLQTRDENGRSFVCRTYNQDELDGTRWADSLFSYPKLASTGNSQDGNEEIIKEDAVKTTVLTEATDAMTELVKEDPAAAAEEIVTRVDHLKGMCARLQVDNILYEWCYKAKMKKTIQKKNFRNIIHLGNYDQRRIVFDIKSGDEKERHANLADDQIELARITDSHSKGDPCLKTREHRTASVTMQCCSPEMIAKSESKVYYNDKEVPSDKLSLHFGWDGEKYDEDSCGPHTFTVCTPWLCKDESFEKSRKRATGGAGGAGGPPDADYANMSIREILDTRFGKFAQGRSPCITFEPGGWWSYELCPGEILRQYHLVLAGETRTGFTSIKKEDEYILGLYPEDVHMRPEWDNLANTTTATTVLATTDKKRNANKEGASSDTSNVKLVDSFTRPSYYYEEYEGGDVCDLDEIADSAIKAGKVAVGGTIARAATVKYRCGRVLKMKVKEDSTCHYMVDVEVPELCKHPLFQVPVMKTPVIRCLEESS